MTATQTPARLKTRYAEEILPALVERFGEERALHDTAACVTEAVTAHLATLT